MKKLLLLLFAIAPLYASAQGLSFDETVGLINDKIKCCAYPNPQSTIKPTGIAVTTDGIITVTNSDGNSYQINLLTEPPRGMEFIRAHNNLVSFLVEAPKGRFWAFGSDTDAKRVAGLLLHLRELSGKK